MDFNLNEPIAERKTKTVYKDGNKTIKLFVENYSKEVTKVENRWALVTEYVDGTPLDVLMEQNPEQEEEYLGVFIDMQLEVLSKRVPSLNRIKDKYKRLRNNRERIYNDVSLNEGDRMEYHEEYFNIGVYWFSGNSDIRNCKS